MTMSVKLKDDTVIDFEDGVQWSWGADMFTVSRQQQTVFATHTHLVKYVVIETDEPEVALSE